MTAAESTKERILVEACKLFQETGLGGFTMRKLASRLSVSATALYRHFQDKEQLVVAVCCEGFERFAGALWKALDAPDDWQRLRHCVRQYWRFARAEPDFYRVMFLTPVSLLGGHAIPKANQRRIDATFEFLVDRVRAASGAQPFAWSDPRQISASIWAHCHGLVALRLDGHLSTLDEEQFESFYVASMDAHFSGLLTTGTESGAAGSAA